MNLIQLKQKDLLPLRKKQWEKQDKKCPILDKEIPFEKSVLDHCHISKKEIKEGKVGEDGKGLLRGVLDPAANAWEGKVLRSFIRVGLHKKNIDISDALENLAKYLRKPLIEQKYIHPTEVLPPEYLKKRDFNRVKKYYFQIYPRRKKLPVWKLKTKLNGKWVEMIKRANEIYEQEKK